MIALLVKLQNLWRANISYPHVFITDNNIQREIWPHPACLKLELRHLVRAAVIRVPEHLDIHGIAIHHIEFVIRTQGDTVNALKLTGCLAARAELTDIFTIVIQNHNACILQPVGDQYMTGGQKRHILRFTKTGTIGAGDILFTQHSDQVLTILRKNINNVSGLFNHPDSALRIIGADPKAMRARPVSTFPEMVPLGPHFLNLALAVHHVEQILPGSATALDHIPAH